jgi:cysteine desulfurase / selenocysteine lyase
MVCYFDHAATSYPKAPPVAAALMEAMTLAGGNPGRATHRLARQAADIIAATRGALARLLGAADPQQLILTYSATDALNLAIKGLWGNLLQPGDQVITTTLEHNSVLRPLQSLVAQGLTLTIVDFEASGYVSPATIAAAITPRTRLLAVTAASNVLGTVQPLVALGELAAAHRLIFLVDAAQAVGSIPLDVASMQIDLLAAGGHKALLGPPGTGFLYVAPHLQLNHWRQGGTGNSSLQLIQPQTMPERLEAGTPNTWGWAGLLAAIEFVTQTGIDQLQAQTMALTRQLLTALAAIPTIEVFGPQLNSPDPRVGTIALRLAGFTAAEVAAILDEHFDIAVRAGGHCAPLVHQQLQTTTDGLVRISLGYGNTSQEVAKLQAALQEISQAAITG